MINNQFSLRIKHNDVFYFFYISAMHSPTLYKITENVPPLSARTFQLIEIFKNIQQIIDEINSYLNDSETKLNSLLANQNNYPCITLVNILEYIKTTNPKTFKNTHKAQLFYINTSFINESRPLYVEPIVYR